LNKLREFLYILFFALFIYGCAQISRPEGGPKDVEPPNFVSANPENFSILFDKEEIKIQFDEFVKLNNPTQQIIFSPPILPRPEISPLGVASKEVKIKLALDSLQDNTTYTINFGQSIEDNNEGNPLPFFKYVFSTGDYLDSLKLDGSINDMNFRETPEFVSVLLYEKDSLYTDSVVYNSTPTYVSYAMDSTNAFSLENMKAGIYKLIALEDKNNDYKFNQGREKIGFVEEFIELPTEVKYRLNIFDTYKDFKPIRPKQVSKNHLVFGYEGVLDSTDYKISLLTKVPDTLEYRITKRRDADTLDYWFSSYYKTDSLIYSFEHKKKLDSLIVITRDMEADSLLVETKPRSTIGFNEDFYIRANLPITQIDTSKINLVDVDTIAVDFTAKLDKFQNQVQLQFEKQDNKSYKLTIFPDALTDFYGNTNDTIKVNLRTKSKADFSVVALTISNVDRYPIIVQLVDDKEKVEKSVTLTNTNKYTFEYVKPGKYFIKVIYDDNKNGVWDSGNYLKNIQPEIIKYVEIKDELRANWDLIQLITLPEF
jgi:uncharacterized protein (DUF2141 family)